MIDPVLGTNPESGGLKPLPIIVFGVFLIFFGSNEIIGRLLIEVEGTIISSQTTTGNRPVTYYTVRDDSGREQI